MSGQEEEKLVSSAEALDGYGSRVECYSYDPKGETQTNSNETRGIR